MLDFTEEFPNWKPDHDSILELTKECGIFEDDCEKVSVGDYTIVRTYGGTDAIFDGSLSIIEILENETHHSYWGIEYYSSSWDEPDYYYDSLLEITYEEKLVKHWRAK